LTASPAFGQKTFSSKAEGAKAEFACNTRENMSENEKRRNPGAFLLVNLGLLFTASGIVLFKAPNGFAMGGTSGISIIAAKFLPAVNLGLIMLVVNMLLNVVGFAFLGRDFGVKTVCSSFALSFYVWLCQIAFPLKRPLTGDPMLELFFAIALPAVGSALIFNQNSSTGGTDIIAKLLTKKTRLPVGKTLLLSDILIAFLAIFALGVRQGLYSILGVVLKCFLVDIVIENLNIRKKMEIITSNPDPIEQFIFHELNRSATIAIAEGAYSNEQKKVLTVVVDRRQGIKLRDFVHSTDKSAFIIITNTSEIIGNGFRNTNAL
jgi:Uncharacterized conserved protein